MRGELCILCKTIALIMCVLAVAFVFFAVTHPEMSFPWGNTVTYFLYGIYLIIMTVLTIHGFKLFYDA